MRVSSYLLGNNRHPEATGNHLSTITCIRTLVLIALRVSLLLQTVAIVAPGWRLEYYDKYSYQRGLFYYVRCERIDQSESCKMKRYSDDHYFDATKEADSRQMEIVLR